MVGLADFAATKMRDKESFPGPGSYSPRSESGKAPTIANRYASHSERKPVTSTDVGPGKYDIRSTIGGGPKYSFSPRAADSGDAAPATPSPRKSSNSKKEPVHVPELPKQFSMSSCPSSPRFSLYGRTQTKDRETAAKPGPGQYTIPSTVGGHGVTLSPRFQPVPTDAEEVPGPGSYDVSRFGDKLPAPKAPHIPHAAPRENILPGPGSYEVVGDLEQRLQPKHPRISTDPLFGGRIYPPEGASVAPGPGTYEPENGTVKESIAKKKGITISNRIVPSGELESIYPKPGPGEYVMPSTFGDQKKGFTLLSRREELPPRLIVPGAGSYNPGGTVAEEIAKSHQGIRFNGGRPFDASADVRPARLDEKPGPGAYEPKLELTSPRARGFQFNSRTEGKHDNPFSDLAGAPGPGTYNPKTIHTETAAPGFTFYKGSFSP